MKPITSLHRILTAIAACTFAPHSAFALDGSFSQTLAATYDWSTPANWTGNVVADGANFTGTFSSGVTGLIDVNLDTDRIIGNLTFDNHAWRISGTNTLTLDTSTGTPSVTGSTQNATLATALDGTKGISFNSNVVLSGDNTYSGITSVGATTPGSLYIASNNALGATGVLNGVDVTINSRVVLNNGVTVTGQTISISSNANSNFGSLVASGTAEWAGDVLLNNNNARIGTLSSASQLTVSGKIKNGTSANATVSGTAGSTIILSGASEYTGSTIIYRGNVKLDGGNNRLPTTTSITLGGTSDASQLDLNGNNQTLSGISSGSSAGTRGVTNTSVNVSTLILGGSNTRDFSSTSATSYISGNLSIEKNGANTQTLGNENTYTGNTLINAGALTLAETRTMQFFIGADGVNNGISGAGTMNLDGTIIFDLSAASAMTDGSWNIVSSQKNYGTNFSVQNFTNNAGEWTFDNYKYVQSTGVLTYTMVPETSSAALLSLAFGTLALRRRKVR